MSNPQTYSESDLEVAALEWFAEIGYETIGAPEISPDGDYPEREEYSDVILKERLLEALRRNNPHLPEDAIEEAYHQFPDPIVQTY